jgi:hypothetical protein
MLKSDIYTSQIGNYNGIIVKNSVESLFGGEKNGLSFK